MRACLCQLLLAAACLACGASPAAAAELPEYVIQPPDILRVEASGLPKHSPPLAGEHLVQPDGKISLGHYGSVAVAGLNAAQARAAIRQQIAAHLKPQRDKVQWQDKLQIRVQIAHANSQVCYLLWADATGEQILRLPLTGRETLADALATVEKRTGLPTPPTISLARPLSRPQTFDPAQLTTNPAAAPILRHNDRVYIGLPPPE